VGAVHVARSEPNRIGWQPRDHWADGYVRGAFDDEAVYVEPEAERLHPAVTVAPPQQPAWGADGLLDSRHAPVRNEND
jgi:hypothetical protein